MSSFEEMLSAVKPILEKEYGITQIALFGSCARNEQTPESDVDVLIIEMDRKNGLTIARAQRFLTDYFGKPVDLGLYDSLRPYIKSRIEHEVVYA